MAYQPEIDIVDIPAFSPAEARSRNRLEHRRRHVLKWSMHEKSGRLYCNEDADADIPSLEIYAAR